MASDATVVARMRAAQVPPQVWESSLVSEKFTELVDDFDLKKFQLGEGTILSYVIKAADRKVAPQRAVLACYLIGKSLALKGKTVYCATLPELVSIACERNVSESPAPACGDGYLIVPDITSNSEHFPRANWLLTQSYLASHVSRGGGLVLGTYDAVGGYEMSWLADLTYELQVIVSGFEQRTVR